MHCNTILYNIDNNNLYFAFHNAAIYIKVITRDNLNLNPTPVNY